MADGAENRDREQGKEQKPQAQISFFVRNEAAHKAMKRRKVIDRNNEEHEAVTVSWNWRDTWQNEHKRAFVVAKMAKADMLTEVHDSLQKALDEGVPFEQWKKEIVPKLEGKWLGRSVGELWDELSDEEKAKREPPSEKQREKIIAPERLELIFHTNMSVANAAGHYEQLMKTKDLFPYWRYITEQDARVRDSHRPLHNKVFRWDDPFWETYFPPNGFRCRCRVRSLNKRDMERKGLHVEESNITVDEQGRKVLDVGGSYYKNNPGWDYNPGDSVNHLVSLAKSNEKGRPAQVQADLEADLAKKEAEEAAAAKAKAEAEEQRKAEEARRAEAERQAKEAAAKAEAERQAKEAAAKAEAERLETEKKAKEEERRKAEEAEKAEKARQEAEHKAQEIEHRLQEVHAKAEQRKAEREAKEAAAKAEAERLEAEKKVKEKEQRKAQENFEHKTKEQNKSAETVSSASLLPTKKSSQIQKNDTATTKETSYQESIISGKESQIRSNAATMLADSIIARNYDTAVNKNDLFDKKQTSDIVSTILSLSSKRPATETQLLIRAVNAQELIHNYKSNGDDGAGYYPGEGVKANLWHLDTEEYCGKQYPIDAFTFSHEMMHAIDWLAGKTAIKDPAQQNNSKVHSISSPQHPNKTISTMIQIAAEKDAVRFVNLAIKGRVNFKVRTIQDLETHADDIRNVYHDYLIKTFTTPEQQVHIQVITDLVGMYSYGKLTPPETEWWDIFNNYSFICHDQDICKNQGIDGGNAEVLAGLFGVYFRNYNDMIRRTEKVLPNSTRIYPKVIKRLVKILLGTNLQR